VAEPGDSGIGDPRIHEIRVLVEAIGELLNVPQAKIDLLSARIRTDLETRRRPPPGPPTP